ncbi:hypothetical protein AVEN_262472-1 [Araneus ventricosus]|uniref:Uncharacterized protein n=1 Tax=Araneus ventricosus TaxID=182803 RepID=A0A4Y2G8H9_ARAVE|nr:hypothetical protein AVEN_262472-1 [Araneus ventricosus]
MQENSKNLNCRCGFFNSSRANEHSSISISLPCEAFPFSSSTVSLLHTKEALKQSTTYPAHMRHKVWREMDNFMDAACVTKGSHIVKQNFQLPSEWAQILSSYRCLQETYSHL